MQAQIAYQTGDVTTAQGLVHDSLRTLPGHHDLLEFATRIDAPLPPPARRIFQDRQIAIGRVG